MGRRKKRPAKYVVPGEELVKRSPKWSDTQFREALRTAAKLGHPICGAKRKSGGRCRNYPDPSRRNGRCRFHGARGGRPIEHGLYSKFAKPENFLKPSTEARYHPELADVDDEIATLRVGLRDALLNLGPPPDGYEPEDSSRTIQTYAIMNIIEEIRVLVERRNELAGSYYVRMRTVYQIVNCYTSIFFEAVNRFVKDDETKNKIRKLIEDSTSESARPIFAKLRAEEFADHVKNHTASKNWRKSNTVWLKPLDP